MTEDRKLHAATLAVHAGRSVDPGTGAVTPPIHLSTTFERAADGSFPHGLVYARDGNPNRQMLETCIAALENGAQGVAFGSGMAATTAIIESLPRERARRILVPDDMYHGTRALFAQTDVGEKFATLAVDMGDISVVDAAVRAFEPGLVWIETPSNPLLRVTDIAAVVPIARQAGALVAVDNTWATPIFQKPFALGADMIMHAVTKYIGGSSDLMLGVAVAREEGSWSERLRIHQKLKGGIPSPFECWLALRGVQSLPARMAMHAANAMAVAAAMAAHPKVTAVHYPGLVEDPGHATATRQMSGFGGMLSIEIAGGRDAAFALTAGVRIFTRATSLGGAHSLIEHRASIEGPDTKTPTGLLRLSVGLEHPDDLIQDLCDALAAV